MFAAGRDPRPADDASVRSVSAPGLPLRNFADDEALLAEVLAEVIRADPHADALTLHDRAVELARRARDGDAVQRAAARRLWWPSLDVEQTEVLVRSLTRWFQLVNLAEDNDRVRRLRASEQARLPAPREGSLREAVGELAAAGVSAQRLRRAAGAARRCASCSPPTRPRPAGAPRSRSSGACSRACATSTSDRPGPRPRPGSAPA